MASGETAIDIDTTKVQMDVEVSKESSSNKENDAETKNSREAITKRIGKGLKYMLWASWFLHYHVLLCCLIPTVFALYLWDEEDETLWASILACFCCSWLFVPVAFLSPCATPIAVTILINDVGDFYEEIQSWQVTYIIWGTSCGALLYAILYGAQRDIDQSTIENWLLWPFGIKVKESDAAWIWLVPLVSIAVAIVGGFIANYILAKRYLLDCDESYTTGRCYDGMCCRLVSSHDVRESSRFLGDLASNILAAWGVVKATAYFICVHDDEFKAEDQEKTKFMQLLSTVQKQTSKAGRGKESGPSEAGATTAKDANV